MNNFPPNGDNFNNESIAYIKINGYIEELDNLIIPLLDAYKSSSPNLCEDFKRLMIRVSQTLKSIHTGRVLLPYMEQIMFFVNEAKAVLLGDYQKTNDQVQYDISSTPIHYPANEIDDINRKMDSIVNGINAINTLIDNTIIDYYRDFEYPQREPSFLGNVAVMLTAYMNFAKMILKVLDIDQYCHYHVLVVADTRSKIDINYLFEKLRSKNEELIIIKIPSETLFDVANVLDFITHELGHVIISECYPAINEIIKQQPVLVSTKSGCIWILENIKRYIIEYKEIECAKNNLPALNSDIFIPFEKYINDQIKSITENQHFEHRPCSSDDRIEKYVKELKGLKNDKDDLNNIEFDEINGLNSIWENFFSYVEKQTKKAFNEIITEVYPDVVMYALLGLDQNKYLDILCRAFEYNGILFNNFIDSIYFIRYAIISQIFASPDEKIEPSVNILNDIKIYKLLNKLNNDNKKLQILFDYVKNIILPFSGEFSAGVSTIKTKIDYMLNNDTNISKIFNKEFKPLYDALYSPFSETEDPKLEIILYLYGLYNPEGNLLGTNPTAKTEEKNDINTEVDPPGSS